MDRSVHRVIFFGEASLRKATFEFVSHYNHQGTGSRLIIPTETKFASTVTVQRRQRAGRISNYYYREAA